MSLYHCQVKPGGSKLSESVVFVILLHNSKLLLSIICSMHLNEYLDVQGMPKDSKSKKQSLSIWKHNHHPDQEMTQLQQREKKKESYRSIVPPA